jgi:predicted negative regulator of RcsB-dependent stress response
MLIPNQLYSFYNKYHAAVHGVLAGTALVAVGWYGYNWYSVKQEYRAQRDFAESAEDYYKLFASAKNAKAWQDIEQGLAFRAQQNKSSRLAPYFKVYQADALLQEGKTEDAMQLLNNAIQDLKQDSPLYFLYRIKRALIKLDASSEEMRKEGDSELDQLSQDIHNSYRDMAAYYRGYYAWNRGNKAEARQIWSNINKVATPNSPWAQLAFVKLQGIA